MLLLGFYSPLFSVAQGADTDSVELYSISGSQYILEGNFAEALKIYYKLLDIGKETKNDQLMASSFGNLGEVNRLMGNYEKGLEFFIECLNIKKRSGDKKNIANCYNNIGLIYAAKNDFDKAIENHKTALTIRMEIKDSAGIASSFTNIGIIHDYKGNYAEALKNYSEGLEMNLEIKNKKGASICYNNIGQLHLGMKNFQIAYEYLNLSLMTGREIGYSEIVLGSYIALSHLDSITGNWKGAYEHHKLFSDMEDSLHTAEAGKQIAEMQTRYETEKKENENKILVRENKLKDMEISRQKTQKYAWVAAVFLMALISFLVYNRYKLKQEKIMNEELLKQEKLRIRAMVQAQEQERKRIAEELHDGIGQMLSATKLNVSALENNNQTEFQIPYRNAMELIEGSFRELRNISRNIMPELLVKRGLIPAIKDLADKLTSTALKIFVKSDEPENLPDINANIHLYRILQELLNNIVKYAGATEVHIHLKKNEDGLTLTVEDNGRGFDSDILKTSRGNGWNNIRSRLEILNAKIKIDSQKGKGTMVLIQAPSS